MVYLEVAAPRGIVTLEAAGALNPEVSKGFAYPRIMRIRVMAHRQRMSFFSLVLA